MTIQCCSCKKIREGAHWVTATVVESPMLVSHGYCPACAAKVYEELRAATPARKLAAGRA